MISFTYYNELNMEKITTPSSGYLMVVIELILAIASALLFVNGYYLAGVFSLIAFILVLPGFFIVEPNKAMVLLLFGAYKGTVKNNGFFWVNPFMLKKKISLRVRNFENKPLKVNDKIGNPVMVGDRKSTRLNSSHVRISYAVFCLKK